MLLKSGVCPLRCSSCVSWRNDAVVRASTPALCISPTARCVGARPMTRGRVSSGSRLMALMTARNWVVSPPRHTLNHREPVRALQNHPSPPAVRRSGPSSDWPARGPSGATAPLPSSTWVRMLFRRPSLTGNQQVIAVAVRHRYIQQLPRPDLCPDGRVDVRHRNLPRPRFPLPPPAAGAGRRSGPALKQRDGREWPVLPGYAARPSAAQWPYPSPSRRIGTSAALRPR